MCVCECVSVCVCVCVCVCVGAFTVENYLCQPTIATEVYF